MLFITADPDAYSLQPENAIKVRLGKHGALLQLQAAADSAALCTLLDGWHPQTGRHSLAPERPTLHPLVPSPHPTPPHPLPAPCTTHLQLKKEWKDGDTMLLDLMPFLEAVVRTHVSPRGGRRLKAWARQQQQQALPACQPPVTACWQGQQKVSCRQARNFLPN